MNHQNNPNESFHFRYSAKNIKEADAIRQKYLKKEKKKEETPMERLRRLDQSVTQKAELASLVAGILGALVMGTGLSLVILSSSFLFVLGILVGILGLVGVVAAYPIYIRTLKKERERIAPEILRLTDELLKQ